jgi:MFS family permease
MVDDELHLLQEEGDQLKEIKYTVNEAVEYSGFGRAQILAYFVAGLALMANSITTMLLSFILPIVQDIWELDEYIRVPLVGASSFLGAAFGSTFWGWFSDKYGRKKALFICSVAGTLAGVLSSFSINWIFFLVTRCLAGFAMAGIVVAWNILLEFLPTRHRGTTMQLLNIWWTAGTMIEIALAWILIPINVIHISEVEIGSWRVILFILGLSSLLVLVLYPIIPESPRYLIVANRRNEAEEVLQRMIRWNGKPPLKGSLSDAAKVETTSEQANFILMFSNGFWKITLPIFAMWMICSLVYFGVVVMTPAYFKESTSNAYLEIFLCSLAELPGIAIAAIAIDRIGRRWTISVLFTFAGVFILLLLVPGPSWLMITIAVLSRMCISSGYNSVMIFTPELFPTAIRTTAFGVSAALSQVASIIAMFAGVSLVSYSSTASIIVFGVSAFVGAVCILTVKVETAGSDLQDHVIPSTKETM